jgi:isopentenyl-diphosphate Delta-isomerase
MSDTENVVLLDDDGRPIGVTPKSTVHDTDTRLHLAVSCHVLADDGSVLITRRALTKTTWPGVWTNSFCGHPGPGEDLVAAVRRRGRQELGLELTDIRPVLPHFRYRAVDAGGLVENEICPVFTARAVGTLSPDPAEVAEARWVDPAALGRSLEATPWAFSPWLALQAGELTMYAPTRPAQVDA